MFDKKEYSEYLKDILNTPRLSYGVKYLIKSVLKKLKSISLDDLQDFIMYNETYIDSLYNKRGITPQSDNNKALQAHQFEINEDFELSEFEKWVNSAVESMNNMNESAKNANNLINSVLWVKRRPMNMFIKKDKIYINDSLYEYLCDVLNDNEKKSEFNTPFQYTNESEDKYYIDNIVLGHITENGKFKLVLGVLNTKSTDANIFTFYKDDDNKYAYLDSADSRTLLSQLPNNDSIYGKYTFLNDSRMGMIIGIKCESQINNIQEMFNRMGDKAPSIIIDKTDDNK